MKCWIAGVAVLGPGLPGWALAEPVLAGTQPWVMAEATAPPPAILAATERRRTGATVRFALAAATEATEAESDRAALETIFASGNGDGAVIAGLLGAMHDPGGDVSPTQFHNSVHNAAAGYWHIAVGSTMPSLSLGGHDGVFAAGLLAAMTAVVSSGRAVLFCAYDTPVPPPLAALRQTDFPFAVALVLRPGGGDGARAMLDLRYVAGAAPMAQPEDGLDALAGGNAAARAIPLLRAIAARRAASVRLPYLTDAHLEILVCPC
ncbi:beta-ketoacyl synthase chain length factor [Humitalea sp. 24SJ18S-53]|uniref:beta-ketoacyl synthase chain length factor n=1 Tax=Humitalea sp. 24SJ18S-53 TaxID=3422307 RepID=UPI003D66A3DB